MKRLRLHVRLLRATFGFWSDLRAGGYRWHRLTVAEDRFLDNEYLDGRDLDEWVRARMWGDA